LFTAPVFYFTQKLVAKDHNRSLQVYCISAQSNPVE